MQYPITATVRFSPLQMRHLATRDSRNKICLLSETADLKKPNELGKFVAYEVNSTGSAKRFPQAIIIGAMKCGTGKIKTNDQV